MSCSSTTHSAGESESLLLWRPGLQVVLCLLVPVEHRAALAGVVAGVALVRVLPRVGALVRLQRLLALDGLAAEAAHEVGLPVHALVKLEGVAVGAHVAAGLALKGGVLGVDAGHVAPKRVRRDDVSNSPILEKKSVI